MKYCPAILSTTVLGLSGLFVSTSAWADALPAGHTESSILSILPMLLIFAAVFYFLILRPQNKRAQAHRDLIGNLHENDEIVTNGGLMGTVKKMTDQYVFVEIAEGTQVLLQKSAIGSVLPKGTIATA